MPLFFGQSDRDPVQYQYYRQIILKQEIFNEESFHTEKIEAGNSHLELIQINIGIHY